MEADDLVTHVVFDLDGTLADTRDLVRRAYDVVGVHMPEHAWGLPAEAWLAGAVPGGLEDVAEVHRLKNVALRTLIAAHGVERLPAADLCEALKKDRSYTVGILTGASLGAARATRRALALSRVPILGAGCDLETKMNVLRATAESGIYFDDDYEACVAVADQTPWVVCYVSVGTDVDTLLRGFRSAEDQLGGQLGTE